MHYVERRLLLIFVLRILHGPMTVYDYIFLEKINGGKSTKKTISDESSKKISTGDRTSTNRKEKMEKRNSRSSGNPSLSKIHQTSSQKSTISTCRSRSHPRIHSSQRLQMSRCRSSRSSRGCRTVFSISFRKCKPMRYSCKTNNDQTA